MTDEMGAVAETLSLLFPARYIRMGDIPPGTANALAGRTFPYQLVNAYNASIKKAFLFQGKPFAELKILP